ncbi:glutaminyl-tRNA synthase (glutamine-hydrolyzing) subunit A [Candidatus Daviesbacteria bacterium RIFCSPHIGHO2_01_FULL_36_37]|uniref:Glutamyl-tRNA(Gln) amidotransferase subunit A n=4 Tax=Candidatus Daviesiibacteriota TaxID=1752718 RepID=A0A0G0ERI7_9BACT|nr:MAG: Glutamyl-tRNA(Gln) amidotransferase subunit A [Candidatus Daviesbacteria bacterium GW2011_GWB1_36_5]KKQ15594.1 MAG: Glutamyl-tRNA(Gln) amidotransferase subunit A [Candidatus Daviesbacteria bacterium GW2011_GWA1_36_8]OGE17515.1 MAG: glutaminyl-tRNA synthase (glutamine-hydrolyzing) subunit A [Candidatus Daviesbacteria bacterium RIFCSPHIGHO2_01_FULL_36_37]OGE36648.1 MAG: glutaminyl-tRNA synthase (glutamine-hydrolyzing) subunit A [Candidatus Daviesbacteria bacterium RIFCSPHIGHO2_12_FULL_37_1
MSDITSLTLTQTIAALDEKKFSEEELNNAYLERIKKLDPKLNAFLEINEKSNKIPAAIKSLISTRGLKTSSASKIIENYNPPFNATVIGRLLDKGVSVIGKTNQDEFAMGSSGENSAFGSTKNPWDLIKVPGGSSSGSVAAVAADLAVFALGTDTGGSIRQPASLCGVVGFKPSYGRVSRYGAISMASSLDQIGPIGKSVEDVRLILEWIQGPDGFDSNCQPSSHLRGATRVAADAHLGGGLNGVKVGVPKEYFAVPAGRQGEGLDSGVEKVVKDAIKEMEELGAEIVEISLPNTQYAVAVYYIIMASEVSSNLARFDGIRFGGDRSLFGAEPKRRIMLGTFALSTGYYDDYYNKAAKVRTLIKKDFEKAFEKCDVIVGPVSPTVAWKLGEKISDPLTMYLSDVYTIPASLAGIPGLSVPAGFSEGMPVGVQILGKYMDEETILNVGEVLEKALDIKEKPKL